MAEKKDVSGLIYGLIKKVNLLEKRITALEEKSPQKISVSNM